MFLFGLKNSTLILDLPSPEDPPESDDFNSVESSKSDKSMIFESPQNSNQLSNIQMVNMNFVALQIFKKIFDNRG